MKVSLDTGDREFLSALNRLGSVTIQELCDALGITATAIRQRLTRLQNLDLIRREIVRAGRGRPHHTYRITETGQRALGDNYPELALLLWREITRIEDTEVRERLFERIRTALAGRYSHIIEGETLGERLDQLQTVLSGRGFDVEIDSSGLLPILREHHCPYPELASSDSGICDLEQAVFEEILGADVELTQHCFSGHKCCEFAIRESS
jgi:predicted ArsR family transcriptional regulator